MSHPDPHQNAHPDPREVPSLLVDTIRNFTRLIETEMRLARAEVSQNLTSAAIGVFFFGIAALMALVALNVLAGAIVAYIAATSLGAGTAALIVAAGFLIVAAILGLAGKSRLSATSLGPNRTMNNLQRDVAAVKGATNGHS